MSDVQIKTYKNFSIYFDGAVIFDGDGDGTSAAALWLTDKSGSYLAVTNKQKNDRKLVSQFIDTRVVGLLREKKIGIFDIDAESNRPDLEILESLNLDVEYFDHHTKNFDFAHSIKKHVYPDTRDNCTASITHDYMSSIGVFDTLSKKHKAEQLKAIGLCNDGKIAAAEKLSSSIITPVDFSDIAEYSSAINFGSGNGILDSVSLLKNFVDYDLPLEYLRHYSDISDLVNLKESTFKDLMNRAENYCSGKINFYVLPHSTLNDKELSVGAYNELINSFMKKDSEGTYIFALQAPDEEWRISLRSANPNNNMLELAEKLASSYHASVVGRNTAAGFGFYDIIDTAKVWNNILRYAK